MGAARGPRGFPLNDVEMAYRSGRSLWRRRRFSLRDAALTPTFSRAPADGPVGDRPATAARCIGGRSVLVILLTMAAVLWR